MPKMIKDLPNIYIGVDPGASGGLASLINGPIHICPMPDTERDIWEWFRQVSFKGVLGSQPIFAIIEKVHAMPGNGVSSMFRFGQNYGFLRACLIASNIPFDEVTPQAWQKALGIPKRGKTERKPEFKNRLKAKAQQLFPDIKVTPATADALLISEYCKRRKEGTLGAQSLPKAYPAVEGMSEVRPLRATQKDGLCTG